MFSFIDKMGVVIEIKKTINRRILTISLIYKRLLKMSLHVFSSDYRIYQEESRTTGRRRDSGKELSQNGR